MAQTEAGFIIAVCYSSSLLFINSELLVIYEVAIYVHSPFPVFPRLSAKMQILDIMKVSQILNHWGQRLDKWA